MGLFLAFGAYNPVYYLLYKLVPGFDLFRAPARWLLLYAFGAAILAALTPDFVTSGDLPATITRTGLGLGQQCSNTGGALRLLLVSN